MSDDIPVSDDFQPAPGVKYEDEPAVAPEAPSEPEKAPETPVNPEPTAAPEPEPVKPEPVVERPKKATPIATLLEKKHELEETVATKEARIVELEALVQKAADQPTNAQTDDDIKALVEEYGLDEALVTKLVNTARKGVNPELPKEVQDLLSERQAEKQQQAELTAFNKRVDSLAKALPTEQFSDPKVREKLLELAYSTEKAPDGEPYFQKELSELYFAYIKPEIEPGKTSAEPSQGGTQAGSGIVDFEDIYTRDNPKDIEAMDSDTFTKYNAWVKENRESRTPLKRS
jgi:hypothetical protein